MEVIQMAKITPLLLGIGGDSGTGESTCAGGIYKIFGSEKITNINLDDDHTFDRAQRKTYCFTALHPAANNMSLMGKQARQKAPQEGPAEMAGG
jgi:phosphoribulokinase